MTSILVMCTGNICRSPMAEGMLRDGLRARFDDAAPTVSSAGTAGLEGNPAMAESVQAAAELGSDISAHRARALTITMPREADLVICMAAEHRDDVIRLAPGAAATTFTLKELVRLLDQLPPVFDGEPDDLVGRVAEAQAMRSGGFAGNPYDEDVVDPLGMPLESYRAIAWELDQWIGRLLNGLYGPAAAVPEASGEA
jgi:low molecular weight protein-tyrosine phosphatase